MYADVRLGVGWNVFIRPIGDGLVHLRCGEESGETLDVGSAWREETQLTTQMQLYKDSDS